jgi:predicted metalloprotease with PDZ domain
MQGRPRVIEAVPFGSPAYAAGLERDDAIVSIGGMEVGRAADVERAIAARRPGESVPIVFERRGARVSATLRLVEHSRLELVPVEQAGQRLTDAQRQFREVWLSSAAERVLNVASVGGASPW